MSEALEEFLKEYNFVGTKTTIRGCGDFDGREFYLKILVEDRGMGVNEKEMLFNRFAEFADGFINGRQDVQLLFKEEKFFEIVEYVLHELRDVGINVAVIELAEELPNGALRKMKYRARGVEY